MAFETMRRFLTPQEEENTVGGSNTLLEDFEEAINKTPKSKPLSEDEWARWEAAAPGATEPIDPRATIDYLERFGPFPADPNQLPAPLPRVKMEPVTTLQSFPKLGEKLAGSLTSLAAPIPVKTAPSGSDATAATASTLAPVTADKPAGKPNSDGAPNLPAPSSEGAGGDASERDLYLARLAAQSAAGFGGMGAGKNIDMGIADTLGERLKQVQALRAKREERQQGLDIERSQNNQTLEYYKRLFPDKAEDLEASLRDATGKGQVFRQGLDAWLKREEFQNVKKPTAEARVGLLGAQKDAVPEKLEDVDASLAETKRHNLAMEAAAALAAQRAARGAAEDRGVRPEALTNRLKDLNAQTKPFQEIVSSLQEADAALSALGTGQISRGAKIASKIPLVGESLVSTPELRAMQGQEGLKQSYQKLKTGLAAVGQELASFERQFGTDWQADPRKAPMAIETLKQITQNALRRTQAPFGAGTGNPAIDQMEVLSLLKNTGGLTADNPIFQPNPKLAAAAGMAPAPATGRPAKPTAAPAGKAVLWSLAEGKWKAVPAENADAAVASGKYER